MIAVGSRKQVYPVLLPEAPRLQGRAHLRRAKRRPEARVLLFVVLFILPAVLYVSGHVEVTRTGYQISRLREEVAALERENERLQAKAASLADLGRIERIATTELGMVVPAPTQVAVVEVTVPMASQPKSMAATQPTWWQQVQAWFLNPEARASEQP